MTREEAINMCKSIKEYLTGGNPVWSKEEVEEALDMAIRALKGDMYCPSCGVRLVSENEYAEPNAQNTLQHVGNVGSVGNWIPCSERLPEKGDNAHYLISISDKALFRDNVYDAFYKGYVWIVGDYHEVVDEHVLAWMPLPQPYGGESE